MTNKSSLASARLGKIFWLFFEKFGLVALSILSFFVFARLLTPSELGLGVLILSIVELFSFFYSSTIDNSYISFKDPSAEEDGAAFWSVCFLSLLTALLIFSGFYGYFDKQDTYFLCAIAVLFLPLQAISRIHIVHLRKKGAFKSLAKRTIWGKVAGMVVGIYIAFVGGGAWAIISQAVVMSAVASILLFMSEKRPLPFNYNPILLKKILFLGVPASVKALSWNFVGKGIVIIVEVTLGTAAVGFYNFANRLIQLPREAIYGALMGYAHPVFSNRKNRGQDINTLYLTCTKLSLVIITPLFIGLSAVGDLLVTSIFGEKWIPSIPILTSLSMVTAFTFFFMFFSSFLVAIGKTSKALKTEVLAGVFALLIVLVLTESQGLFAVVYGFIGRLFVTIPLNTIAVMSVSEITFRELVSSVYKPLLASFILYVSVYIFRIAVPIESDMIELILSCLVGGTSYLLSYVILDRNIFKQVKTFLHDK